MKKVMILASGEFFETLCSKLSKRYTVFQTSDPMHAKAFLLAKPDALIINMSLPGMDSLEFLKANADHLPPVIIATTPYISNALITELSVLNASYLIRLPCNPEILQDRLAEQLKKRLS